MKYEDLRIDVIRLENVDIVTVSDPTNGRNGGGGRITTKPGDVYYPGDNEA